MALELRQQLKLTQQLIMTPQLQMAIKLLQLSRLELLGTVQQELEENPALDEILESSADEKPDEPAEETVKADPPEMEEVTIKENIQEDIDWSNYIDEYNSTGKTSFETERRETTSFEPFLTRKTSLQDHLLWQLLMTSPSSQTETIGSIIAGNLNTNGYLATSVEDLSALFNIESDKIQETLSLMQTFDPIGICARDLKECLMIQIDTLGVKDRSVINIIENHLHNLENKNYKAICKDLKINIDQVAKAIDVIKNLDPRPGRQFADDEPQYITPDIYVYKLADEFIIMINDDGMPKLRVNTFYRNAIKGDGDISANTRNYVKDKMRSAAWLIRSIHQRQKTIYRVMESILKFQYDFFEKGITHLKPMVLRDVAEDIGMHESTISRVTTNKYAHTPQGIFELKYFFNSPIKRVHGEDIASASVQKKIKQIIEAENPQKPYSDDKISKILKSDNINIARRTVAKYREILRVLPSSKRKQL
jgi:RNA polymerase sigma-54 factor